MPKGSGYSTPEPSFSGGSNLVDAADAGTDWSLSSFGSLLETGGAVYTDVLSAKQKVQNIVGGTTTAIPTGDAVVSPTARAGGIDLTMVAVIFGGLFLLSKVIN